MLSNIELFQLCDAYKIHCNGIYLRDALPREKLSGFYIYNLDDSKPVIAPATKLAKKALTQSDMSYGTHWTCSIAYETHAVYFDPFGVSPPTEVNRFIKTKYKRYGTNKWTVQSLKSSNCGWFCLAFALFIKQNRIQYKNLMECANAFINLFGDNDESDEVLRSFFRQIKPIHPLTRRKLLNQR